MIKDLNDKIFKHHIYAEHYDVALDLIRILILKKTSSMAFNKELWISKEYLV